MKSNRIRIVIDIVIFAIFFFVEFDQFFGLDGKSAGMVRGVQAIIYVMAALDAGRRIEITKSEDDVD